MDLRQQFTELLGARHVLTGDAIGPRYSQDLWGGVRAADPRLVLRPSDTEEVSAILRMCAAAGQPVAIQGGMTGLVGGGLPGPDEVVVSVERMNRIEEIDEVSRTMTVQAGVTLAEVQDSAAAHGLEFPLDLTARGSCTIGGCLATNAGGNRVLRHGTARDLTLGIEAVLADGSVISGLRKLLKNNTGQDLKHLFIGTEGTLGVITRAVLRLRPLPVSRQTCLCGLASVTDAILLLNRLQASLPGGLAVFEAIWNSAFDLVRDCAARLNLRGDFPIYVLLEHHGNDQADSGRFLDALGACDDLISDAAVATNANDAELLWSVREQIPMRVLAFKPLTGFDVSIPAARMEEFFMAAEARLTARWPAARLVAFGHIGDGNIHLAVITGTATPSRDKPIVEDIVYSLVEELSGSISGEHGIGFEKRRHLHHSRTPAEIDLMRAIKATLDPGHILNRGRVLDP